MTKKEAAGRLDADQLLNGVTTALAYTAAQSDAIRKAAATKGGAARVARLKAAVESIGVLSPETK